ncbi:MAG TPA: hypothetical protein VE175_10460, partial [Woeseiaceae bacterium]|nr:hypothetical protein [Woeseiaceae bacterium]
MRRGFRALLLACSFLTLTTACDGPAVERVSNTPPPEDQDLRIVTLAPHLAELVFAVGAGAEIVGVSAYTVHPPEAAALPMVGDAFSV